MEIFRSNIKLISLLVGSLLISIYLIFCFIEAKMDLEVVEYKVLTGDTLAKIAYKFNMR